MNNQAPSIIKTTAIFTDKQIVSALRKDGWHIPINDFTVMQPSPGQNIEISWNAHSTFKRDEQ